nr:MAG TPA: Protein of unknown function (DUF1353) [Caudoviricetes sp.]
MFLLVGKKRKIVKILDVSLSNDPDIKTRAVLFDDSLEVIKQKQKKQFRTSFPSSLTIKYEDGDGVVRYHTLFAHGGYIFDGATIPFNIGKGNMKVLIPALFHDVMCDDKSTINYQRHLSSLIFKACLLKTKVNPVVTEVMYRVVDIYQTPIWIVERIKNYIKKLRDKWIKRH